jgi:hypothetical protein
LISVKNRIENENEKEEELRDEAQNEKATQQLRRPFLQGRIVPTEANSVKTLWRNLMSGKRGVSIYI